MAGLDAGALDRKVRLEVATRADDGFNTTEVFVTAGTPWARYLPARGQEARGNQGRDAMLMATFQIYWRPRYAALLDNTGAYRLRYPAKDDGQVWDIKSAVEIGRRDGIEIVAVARQAAG